MKTVVLLSAHRCGSTAMLKVFQKHPDVKIVNKDQNIANWEPNFWYWADIALKGDRTNFDRKLRESGVPIPKGKVLDKNRIFGTWDKILEMFGPIVFDKSPISLQSRACTALMLEYIKERKKQFDFFAMIRDPKDAIASQYAKWPGKDINWWKREWLKKHKHLEDLQTTLGFRIYRYEDVAKNPEIYIKKILEGCGLIYNKSYHSHFKPVHVGRYRLSKQQIFMGAEMKAHLKKYNYGRK